METPRLVAPGVKSFMDFTLKNCRQIKDTYTTVAVNVSLAVIFVLAVGGFLYYKYRGKPTREEEEARKRQGQEYVMRKLGSHVATRQIEEDLAKKRLLSGEGITGMPMWEKSLLLPGISS